MEIWSDGKESIIYDDSGLTFFAGDEVAEIVSLTGDPVFLGAKRSFRTSKERFLAVDADTRTAIAGEPGDVPYLFDLSKRPSSTRLAFTWGFAASLGNREFLAVLPEDDKLYYRFIRLGSSGAITTEDEAPLPPLMPADFELLAGRKQNVTSDDAVGPFTVQQSAFGLVVVDHGAGRILFAHSGEKQFSSGIVLPLTEDETCHAVATAAGIAVAVSTNEKHSVLALFHPSGEKLHQITKFGTDVAWGGGVPFVSESGTLCWLHSTEAGTVTEIDPHSFEILGHSRIPSGTAFFSRISRVGPDEFVLGSRSVALRILRSTDGTWTGKSIERKELPKKAKQLQLPVTGKALLQLRALSERWDVPAGKTVDLALELSNSGGESKGLTAEVSGEALASVRPQALRVGTTSVPFVEEGGVFRASVPEMALSAAVEKGTKRTKIEPTVEPGIRITLEGHTTGTGLLMIRVGTSGGVSSATGKTLRVL